MRLWEQGWEFPVLDIVIDKIQPQTSRNVEAVEWLEELTRTVQVVRDQMKENQKESQKKRKDAYDAKSVQRTFKPGDMVLVKLPGIHGKFDSAWVNHMKCRKCLLSCMW